MTKSAAPPALHCICVPPEHVAQLWPHVSHLIRSAMLRGGLSDFADVERAILSGGQLLWLAVAPSQPSPATGSPPRKRGGVPLGGGKGGGIYAAAVTALADINGERVCTIVACGGRERGRWLHLIAALEDFARAEGCRAIRILGRRGWARLLPDYALTRILLEKPVQSMIPKSGCRFSEKACPRASGDHAPPQKEIA